MALNHQRSFSFHRFYTDYIFKPEHSIRAIRKIFCATVYSSTRHPLSAGGLFEMGNRKKSGSVKIGGNLKKAFRLDGAPINRDPLCPALSLVLAALIGMCYSVALGMVV